MDSLSAIVDVIALAFEDPVISENRRVLHEINLVWKQSYIDGKKEPLSDVGGREALHEVVF